MKTLAVIVTVIALLPAGAGAQSHELFADSALPIAAMTTPSQPDTVLRPADFVDVDKEPEIITKVEPTYPPEALASGTEGKVWVKIWVDTAGKAREVILLKSDAEIFNASAIKAAGQFVFKPAMIKGKPVDVWVAVPFKFRLAEKKEAASPKVDTTRGGAMYGVLRFVIDVLQGPVPDTSRVREFLTDDAQSVAGGRQKLLRQSIDEQRGGQSALEQPGRRMLNCTLKLGEGDKSGYIIARTVKGANESTSHYHTIVIAQDTGGSWKIMCWQSWQGARTP